METIVAIVGFLGAGKTTLLKKLISEYIAENWKPFVVLNDYENAALDSQQLTNKLDPECIQSLSGSCICCSGILELRDFVNRIPPRPQGVTLIEANGTSDAVELMGFLGVGIDERFLPPVQISVVDVKNWQQRGEYNELETNQVQVSSLIILTHLDQVEPERFEEVIQSLNQINPEAQLSSMKDIDLETIQYLSPSQNEAKKLDHRKAHWASASCDLPDLPDPHAIQDICDSIPKSILRVKGVTRVANDDYYSYFERVPSGEVTLKVYNGVPTTGTKLLTIGVGSDPAMLEDVVKEALLKSEIRIQERIDSQSM